MLSMCILQAVVASYDDVFPAVDEGAPDVDDNCKANSYHIHVVISVCGSCE